MTKFFHCKNTKKKGKTFIYRMIFSRNHFRLLAAGLFILLTVSGCKKFSGDVTVPAFLHLDGIDIIPQTENAPSSESGFYTSDVDAVQLICYFKGDTAETTIGTFQLPCTVPLLRHGTMDYLTIIPAVKQNGISATRIEYPYYKHIRLEKVTVAADSITHLGTQDASGQWRLQTHYYEKPSLAVLVEDYFEPTSFSTNFDSTVVWVKDDAANACSGQGYGRVHVTPTDQLVTFYIPQNFTVSETKYLYLEMDYWTDVDMQICLTGFQTAGSSASTMSVMMLYANRKWQKIYINLGKTWSQFNYNNPIALSFQAVNTGGIEGDVRIDNVKLITI